MNLNSKKIYLCIDLKCFYASCECVERGLDPFTTNLVVADPSRGKGAICLAVSPSLKSIGVKNRCRLFEIDENISYITAKPRMKRYIEISADIYEIYLKYVSKDDIHVYSIDECFIDATTYLKLYNLDAHTFAKKIIDDVYDKTGICSTAGIGTNLYLAKIALDIIAKHNKTNIGYLDEKLYKEQLWHHRPITDFWNVGRGTADRLKKYGVYDMHGITLMDEKILYKEFGVNAEFLIDHAYGKESCTIKDIHEYKNVSKSLSNGQVLSEDYSYKDALLILKEMIDVNVLELIDKEIVCDNISLMIGYSKDKIKPSGASIKLNGFTSSEKVLKSAFLSLFEKIVNKNYPIRKMSISFNNVKPNYYESIDLFSDVEENEKEKRKQKTIIEIKKKFGKNSIVKGMDLLPKATTIKRNKLIGGHNEQ